MVSSIAGADRTTSQQTSLITECC